MLRSVVRTHLRTVSSTNARRNFVSTVLLSKSYEDKTLAELRDLARQKGLPVSGSKATLITRIQQQEKTALDAVLSSPESVAPKAQPQTRDLSTSGPARAEVSPSIPSTSFARPVFDIKIPDVSTPPPEEPIQVPFVPDFWESSQVKAQERASQPTVPETPKIVITAGAATHVVGPTYNLTETNDSNFLPTEAPSSPTSRKPSGILGDVIDDLGIPPEVFAAQSKAATQEQHSTFEKSYSRPLDKDEKNGVYAFLGILVGSWLAAGFAAPKKTQAKRADAHH